MGELSRLGDSGYTTIATGDKVAKDHPVIEVLGMCDELICRLGVAKLYIDRFSATLNRFQRTMLHLYDVFSSMGQVEATDLDKEIHFLDVQVEEYGRDIGRDTKKPVIPDLTKASVNLQLARVSCRTLERRIVTLKNLVDIDPNVLSYINRLSDVLYLMAIIAERTYVE